MQKVVHSISYDFKNAMNALPIAPCALYARYTSQMTRLHPYALDIIRTASSNATWERDELRRAKRPLHEVPISDPLYLTRDDVMAFTGRNARVAMDMVMWAIARRRAGPAGRHGDGGHAGRPARLADYTGCGEAHRGGGRRARGGAAWNGAALEPNGARPQRPRRPIPTSEMSAFYASTAHTEGCWRNARVPCATPPRAQHRPRSPRPSPATPPGATTSALQRPRPPSSAC